MRVYEVFTYDQEFDVNVKPELKPDDIFSYHLYYSSYGGEAHGRWRQDGDTIFLTLEIIGKILNRYE